MPWSEGDDDVAWWNSGESCWSFNSALHWRGHEDSGGSTDWRGNDRSRGSTWEGNGGSGGQDRSRGWDGEGGSRDLDWGRGWSASGTVASHLGAEGGLQEEGVERRRAHGDHSRGQEAQMGTGETRKGKGAPPPTGKGDAANGQGDAPEGQGGAPKGKVGRKGQPAGPPRPDGATFAVPAAFAGLQNCAQTCPCRLQCLPSGSSTTFDLEYFRQWAHAIPHYSAHNGALKWFRSIHAGLDGFLLPLWVDVRKLQHFKGPSYSFLDEVEPWSWASMVAALDDESMAFVVTDGGRSRGLVSCEFSPRPNSYDHASSKAIVDEGVQVNVRLPVWDFLFTRDDRSSLRLHPEFKTTKVKAVAGEGHASEVALPFSGKGGSSGPGTFQAHQDEGVLRKVRFDAKKNKKASWCECRSRGSNADGGVTRRRRRIV